MNPMKKAVVGLMLVPMLSLAAPPEAETSRETQRLERAQRRQRMKLVLELSDELGLDSAQALKLDATLSKFEERRRPLLEQVRDAAKTLKRAANGDPEATGQVDAAAQRAFDARAQLVTLDREMFQAMAKELPPQKRAQLALLLARSRGLNRDMAEKLKDKDSRLQRRMMRMHGPGWRGSMHRG
ncbi:hypothetical protein P2318_23905 [Myxococcaceae bacterium GXIMD 01537]